MNNSFSYYKDQVISEISECLNSFNEDDLQKFVKCLIDKKNRNIYGIGAGRMGYGLRAFIMRLNHLGIYNAYFIGDTYMPPMTDNDILIVCSGSGETKTIMSFVHRAIEKANPTIIGITGNIDSSLAKCSTIPIKFKSSNGGMNSADNDQKINSIQPMTTLNEQTMFILFDIITLKLMNELHINAVDTKKFHFNVE